MTAAGLPERLTADALEVALCTLEGVDHDWRPHAYAQHGRPWTSWRCVWCHALACGDHGEADPCWRPYHHAGAHRSRAGVVWPLGGHRPDGVR